MEVVVGLNPTLDWICALTFFRMLLSEQGTDGLNPTLDWICALTTKNPLFIP